MVYYRIQHSDWLLSHGLFCGENEINKAEKWMAESFSFSKNLANL
jgi:hypothetical protein